MPNRGCDRKNNRHTNMTGPLTARSRASALGSGLFVFILSAVLCWVSGGSAALAAPAELSQDDQTCLGCHEAADLQKTLANAETLSLHVSAEAFAKSVHAAVGCTGCHADVDLGEHPSAEKEVASARQYSLAAAELCRTCHGDKYELYEGSLHAAALRSGNEAAPVCSDCHRPHELGPKATYATVEAVPCRNCHSDIFDAYAQSMHGKARAQAGASAAPLCSDCHSAHEVKAASAGEGRRQACLNCHAEAVTTHKEWLPNTGLHFRTVSCPACHAPNAKRRIDLRVYDAATQQQVASGQTGVPRIEGRIKAAEAAGGNGINAMELWNLISVFTQEGSGKMVLRGRLEVSDGVEAHRMADKTKALSDCATCHRQGAEAFQSVTVSIAGPDGRPVRYGADQDVLHSPVSIDAVRGFYAIGGTRIKLLDVLLLMALGAGIAVPLGHLTMRWAFRRYLKRIEEEKVAAAATAAEAPLAADRGAGSDASA
jgi:hypothetical protein